MRYKMINEQFDFHVDAKYYGYQWTEALYITVSYSALKDGDKIISSIDTITVEPWLMGSIITHGYWMTVNKEMIEAAQDKAAKEFNKQGAADNAMLKNIHPTIASALAPFI